MIFLCAKAMLSESSNNLSLDIF